MDKKFWDTIGLILVLSNALGVVVLFEMIFFKFPYITIFAIVFYFTWDMNKKMFKVKLKHKAQDSKSQTLNTDKILNLKS